MKKLFCVVSLTFGHLVIAKQPQVAQSSPLPGEVEVVSVEQQSWYEAEDKAVTREFASPRNSRAQHISIADISIQDDVKVMKHKHAGEDIYHHRWSDDPRGSYRRGESRRQRRDLTFRMAHY